MIKKLIVVSLVTIPLVVIAPEATIDKQLKCLVDNVYYEARGEPFQGQVLVAKTTLNRAKGRTICEAVYEPFQFSWTRKPYAITDYSAWVKAANAANKAYYIKSPVHYFHSTKVNPKWSNNKLPLAKVGNHIFYE
jgi:N-acetylmuramoyl-L-alanine amidase